MTTINRTFMAILSALFACTTLLAGDGHDHGAMPGAADSGSGAWLELSPSGAHNIGLQLSTVEQSPIYSVLPAIGRVEAAPGRLSELTSRVSGQVEELRVAEGSLVKQGELLVRMRSALPGDPPPLIPFHAPHDGIVTRLHVTQGSRVSPDEHLLDVVDLREAHVRARVHERQIRRLAPGQQARIRVPAWPDSVWMGTLLRLGGELDPGTGTLPAWFRVSNPGSLLKLNMRADLSILTKVSTEALKVPRSSVTGDFGRRYVYVARDRAALLFEQVDVATGIEDDRSVEILSGLRAGDRVVSRGNYSMEYMPRFESPPAGFEAVDPELEHGPLPGADDHSDHDHGPGEHMEVDDHAGHDHGPGEHLAVDDHAGHDHGPGEHEVVEDHGGHDHGQEDGHATATGDGGLPLVWLLSALLLISLPLNLVLLLRRDARCEGEDA